MSLRLRLTLIVLLVAGLSLATAGVLVRNYIARSLNETLDERADGIMAGPFLLDATRSIIVSRGPDGTSKLAGGSQLAESGFGAGRPVADSGLFVQVRDSEGAVLREIFDNSNDTSLSKPQLDDVTVEDVPGVRRRFETSSVAGSNPANYRVSVASRSTAQGVLTMLVAIPTTDRDSTLSHLVGVEVLATVVGLALAAVASLVLVGAGLRPLRRIEDAAAIIAEGDLSHRVMDDQGPTETMRLGRALNSMMAQIEQAFAAKEASQQQLRQFVADASHELRTPLTSIRGHAELARRGMSDDDLTRATWRIEQEAERMGGLVEDLLLLARFDVEPPLEIADVRVDELVRDAVSDAAAADPSRCFRIDASTPVVVQGDRARLSQVLANLMTNARVHTRRDTPVTVRVAREDNSALIEVIDEGPGLTPEVAAHVFDRFYRADPARSRHSGGAGLGLAIVHAVVTAHGGTAGVHSVPGHGATFWVRLPNRQA
jgi:two-component system, OmpR family, sensor kinase